ncbi:MAG TPA: DUF4350 domain-containing protein [Acidimicrobiales bacterium]|nr:DUF4350 domain-containing protein [Acidimicrobiales bacterium]
MTPGLTSGVTPGLTPPPPSATQRWRSVPLRWRIVLIALAAVAGAELASSTVTGLGGSGSGASGPSSSYDSSATGTEALRQLLTERGHAVDRLTTALGTTSLSPGSTVFVLDPTSWSSSDTAALERVLSQGGRVVLGGPSPGPGPVRSLLGVPSPPVWQAEPAGTAHPVVALPEVMGVQTVRSTGPGSFAAPPARPGEPVPLLQGPGGVLALVSEGRGTLVMLASSSPLQNGSLGEDDNAALALDLVPPGSPVAFDEYDHGFGRPGTGLAGLPASWRWGLGFALLAVLVWIASASRRFGPPDGPGRIRVPPRVEYVDAMATLLSTRPTDQVVKAVAPVRDEARRRLCRRVGLPPDASDPVLADRLSNSWDATALPDGLSDAVLGAPGSAEDIVAVGRALAELDREGGNR